MSYFECSYKKWHLVPLRTQVSLITGLREEVLTSSPAHWLETGRQQQWITNYRPEKGPRKDLDQSLGLQTQVWLPFAKFMELLVGLQYTDKVDKKVNHGLAWDECAPEESRGWKQQRAGGLPLHKRRKILRLLARGIVHPTFQCA